MPTISIDLPGKALTGLQDRVNDFNAQTGQALDLEEWITLHLKEIATARQQADGDALIKRDVDLEVARRSAALRRELLQALDDKPSA